VTTPAAPDRVVTVEVQGRVAVIGLSRPDRGNAVNLAMARGLRDTVAEVGGRPGLGAVVLAGHGSQFCVGGDLRDFAAADAPRDFLAELAATAHDVVLGLRSLPVPVVAAVQGACAGAGLGLALACDLVVAEQTARFVVAYTAAGLSPDCGVSWALTRLLGGPRAADLILTNRPLDGLQAYDWGLVSRVVQPGQVRRAALDLASELADGPEAAMSHSVRLIRDAPDRSLEDHLRREAACIADAIGTPSGAEGVAAFLAKRRPDFAGQRRPLADRRPG
jgi:2-(1,2-epoxy-1,2-dihydrophenyl)acetyl-CoA isomerase